MLVWEEIEINRGQKSVFFCQLKYLHVERLNQVEKYNIVVSEISIECDRYIYIGNVP